jgi:ABC-2 type transport system permease protein
MNKTQSFLHLTKLESKRLFRNKAVIFLLGLFAVVFLLIIGVLNNAEYALKIAICTNDHELNDFNIVELIESDNSEVDIVYVDNYEEGVDLIKYNKVVLFIDVFIDESGNERLDIQYSRLNDAYVAVQEELYLVRAEYTYEALSDLLAEFGIHVDENYFQRININDISDVGYSSRSFVQAFGIGISIMLTMGLAYTVAKDNETNMARNTMYMPIGVNKYMFTKIIPYIIMGLIESIILLVLGMCLFDIRIRINILQLLFVLILFLISTIMLGFVFSNLKNQISAILCNMLTIILPIFVMSTTIIITMPVYLQVIAYAFPLVAFITLFSNIIFNSVIIWECVLYIILQIIVYYFINILILKKKSKS